MFCFVTYYVIQLVLDAIRSLIDKIKGIDHSFEKELRKLEKQFTKMLNESATVRAEENKNKGETTKNEKSTGESVKLLISKDINGNFFVDINPTELNQNDGESVARTIQRIIKDKFNNLINVNGQNIQINKTTNDEFRRSKSANTLMKNPTLVYNNKLKTIVNADEILKVAKNWIGEKINHIRKDDIVEFARGNIMYRVGDNGYVADVLVGTRKNGAAVLYDIVNIYDKKITDASVTMADKNPQRRQNASVDNKIPQTKSDVNIKFSIPSKTDTEYLAAVENGDMETAQKLVDKEAELWGAYLEKETPVKFNHGTKENFNVFKKGDIGFHFGTIEQAKSKAGYIKPDKPILFLLDENGEIKDKNSRIITAYLKIKNPLIFSRDLGEWTVSRIVGYFESVLNNDSTIEIEKFDRTTKNVQWEKVNPKEISNIEIAKTDRAELDTIKKQYERDALSHEENTYSARSSKLLRDFLLRKGYDSIKYLNEYEGAKNDYSYAVFFSNQIKSADPVTYDDNGNVIPLSERFNEEETDIRYSIPKETRAEILKKVEDGQIKN